MPEVLLDTVLEKLKANFGDSIVSAELSYDFPVYVVKKEDLFAIIKFLNDDAEMGFRFLTTACGLHFPGNKGGELCMMYQLHNMPKNWRIRIKAFSDINDTEYPSMTPIFSTANWMERETYDFFGINFKGHPNLKRILNVDDMTYFPMLKQYPLEDGTREDKNDALFGR